LGAVEKSIEVNKGIPYIGDFECIGLGLKAD
jgi:hypothetical protein